MVRDEEIVDRGIEASLNRGAPTLVGGHIWNRAPGEDWQRVSGADADRCSASVNVDGAHAPVAQQPRRDAVRQPALASAEWQLVDQAELEIVRDVVLADGFFQAAIVEVCCRGTGPVAV